MRRIVRSGGALVVGFLATSATVMLSDRIGEHHLQHLGRLDVTLYCQRQYGAATTAQAAEQAAYGGLCIDVHDGVPTSHRIDVRAACELLFGAPARAELLDADDLYVWECVRN